MTPSMQSQADVVVVGSGAFGLSVAFHLKQFGVKDVVVLERFGVVSQTSPRAAGLFKLIQPDETRTQISRLSIDKVLNFERDTGVALPVVRSGSLMIARTPQHAALIGKEVEQSRDWGVSIEPIDGAEVHRLAPYFQPGRVDAACYVPDDVYIEEPASMLNAFLEAGRRLGVQVREYSEVTGVRIREGAVQSVVTEAGDIETPVVVDAAGAWAGMVGAMADGWVPVAPVRHQLFITDPISGVEPHYPITRVIDCAVYVRPARGGLMLGGFENDPLPLDPQDAALDFTIDDVPLDITVLDRFRDSLSHEIGAFHGAAIGEHRGGLFTMTSDGRFLAGPVPGVHGLWSATGCNGSGFSASPGIGQVLAEWITTGDTSINMSTLSPERVSHSHTSREELREAGVWQYAHYYDPRASEAEPIYQG